MAGRKPTTSPGKRLGRSNEEIEERQENTPIYLSQKFKPPKTLTTAERKVWKWLVKVFRETVNCRVSDADIHLMELYCRAKVATDEADAALKADDSAYVIVCLSGDKDSEIRTTAKPNPNIKKRKDNADLCIKLFNELGLSPVARARMGLGAANAKKKTDVFEGLMNRTDD